MQKHVGDQRQKLLSCGEIGCNMRYGITRRHKAIGVDKPHQPGSLCHQKEEKNHVNADNDIIDDRIISSLNCITDWYHNKILS